MANFNKSEMKKLRELSMIAYELEMSRELQKLESHFKVWHEGEISVINLNEKIHEYHSGVQKELYKTYIMNNNFPLIVGSALARGILTGDNFSTELHEKISPLCALFKIDR